MTNQNSILPPEMHGVMSISGLRGFGKSFLASQADFPDNIIFIDFENKGEGIDAQLDFGGYHAPVQNAGADPLALYKGIQTIIDEIEKDRFTTLVFDNISPMELALNAEAANRAEFYAQKYGLNLKNIKAGRFGGTKAVVNFMISDICNRIHSKGVSLIVTTSHMSKRWSVGGPIPNKYNMKGADRWQELSILTLILIPGNFPPIPSALVQKEQLGTIAINTNPTEEELEAMKRGEDGHDVGRRLPPKIAKCTFQEIRRYLYEPADFKKLLPEEIPTTDEADPFKEKLNKEQMQIAMAAAEMYKKQQEEDDEIATILEQEEENKKLNGIANDIQELLKTKPELKDATTPIVAKELNITIPEAARALAQIRNREN